MDIFVALRDLQDEHAKTKAITLSLIDTNANLRALILAADQAGTLSTKETIRATASMRSAADTAAEDEAACRILTDALTQLEKSAANIAKNDASDWDTFIAATQPTPLPPDGFFAREIANAHAVAADEENIIRVAKTATDLLTAKQHSAVVAALATVTRDEAAAVTAATLRAETQRAREVATVAAAEAVIDFKELNAQIALAEVALTLAQRERAAASLALRESLRLSRQQQ